jgi:hypothetical protein
MKRRAKKEKQAKRREQKGKEKKANSSLCSGIEKTEEKARAKRRQTSKEKREEGTGSIPHGPSFFFVHQRLPMS